MTPKFPSLDVISKPEEKTPTLERRRLPRMGLSSDQFKLNQNGKIFSVADLSLGGMALRVLDPEDLIWFSVGARVAGVLNLRSQKFPILSKVRHVGKDLVGCEYIEADVALTRTLQSLLEPSELGKALKPIPSSEHGSLWYHGSGGTDLILWRGVDGQYRRFTLFALGSYCQWDEKENLTTGQTESSFEISEVRGAFHFETMLLKADARPDVFKMDIAKAVILSSNLPQDLKKWCIRQMSEKE